MKSNKPLPGTGGNRYIPFEDRTGGSSVVFFTRDLSEKGLIKIYDRVCSALCGKVAVKLHPGEAEGPNIIPRPWVKELFDSRLTDAAIIETNTYYEGSRYTTAKHRETLKINGWTFCPGSPASGRFPDAATFRSGSKSCSTRNTSAGRGSGKTF